MFGGSKTEGRVPDTVQGRLRAQVELTQALLAEQRETNRLLRELLARGEGGVSVR